MHKLNLTIALVAAAVLFMGCDNKVAKPSWEPPAETAAPETEETEEAEETAEVEEEEAEPEMAVSQEDIERAVELYSAIHSDDLTEEEKMEKFTSLLEQFEWDEDAYVSIIYDITQCPHSRSYYCEKIGEMHT
jgi:hypothetical protein